MSLKANTRTKTQSIFYEFSEENSVCIVVETTLIAWYVSTDS
jgi:hypothetical protein